MTAATAHSDPDLPDGVSARGVTDADLAPAMALSAEAGWNQIEADWRIFLDLGNVIGLERGGRLIATAATLPFAPRFAWISMVLVTAAERRRGLARWLLRHCVVDLVRRGLVPVLDATPAGRAVYLGLGFHDGWGMRRLVGRQVRPPTDAAATDRVDVRGVAPADWPRLIAYDAAVFGADRSALLRRLGRRLPAAALIAERGGRLAGLVLGREGRVMNQLGPLAADDDTVARALLARAFAAVAPPMTIDVSDRHPSLGNWLAACGFVVERPYTRMMHGTHVAFDDGTRLFAIAGPELG